MFFVALVVHPAHGKPGESRGRKAKGSTSRSRGTRQPGHQGNGRFAVLVAGRGARPFSSQGATDRGRLELEGDGVMFDARDLLTLTGATVATSAVYFVIHQLKPALPRVWTVLLVSELIVWTGGIVATHVTVQSAMFLTLNGFVVAATSLGGIHGVADRGQQPTNGGRSA